MADDSDIPGVEEEAETFAFDNELTEDDEHAIAEADADIAAGRTVSHEAVLRWVRSWGTENELPPPECGE